MNEEKQSEQLSKPGARLGKYFAVMPDEYGEIKRYLDEGKNLLEIMVLVKRSRSLITRIRLSTSYADFKAINNRYKQTFIHNKKNTHTTKSIMTQERFDAMKDLLFQGESNADIHRQTNSDYKTIRYIKDSQTLEEYFEKRRNEYMKYGKYKEQEKQQETMVTFHKTLPNTPSPHKQALADAIDVFIEEEVKIRLQERIRKFSKELEEEYDK